MKISNLATPSGRTRDSLLDSLDAGRWDFRLGVTVISQYAIIMAMKAIVGRGLREAGAALKHASGLEVRVDVPSAELQGSHNPSMYHRVSWRFLFFGLFGDLSR